MTDPQPATGPPGEHWAATIPVRAGDRTASELLTARLWVGGARGTWERPGALVAWFDRPPDALDGALVAALPVGTTWAREPDVDHVAAWRAAARPVRAGAVEIVPEHLADDHDTPAGLHRILLDPGQAFGSGHHDTTAGCLEVLAELDLRGRTVLDVGTGTGILAIAAAKQGAERVLGVDTDPHAVVVAGTNARANDVAIDLAVGSLDDVEGRFDVVLANLLTATLLELADDLAGSLVPMGWLVASGVGAARGPVVAEALADAGLVDVEVRERGEWVVLVARAPAP